MRPVSSGTCHMPKAARVTFGAQRLAHGHSHERTTATRNDVLVTGAAGTSPAVPVVMLPTGLPPAGLYQLRSRSSKCSKILVVNNAITQQSTRRRAGIARARVRRSPAAARSDSCCILQVTKQRKCQQKCPFDDVGSPARGDILQAAAAARARRRQRTPTPAPPSGQRPPRRPQHHTPPQITCRRG